MAAPICDKCNKRPACVHIRAIQKNGDGRTLNLCAQCAIEELRSNMTENIIGQLLREATPENIVEELVKLSKMTADIEMREKNDTAGETVSGNSMGKTGTETCEKCGASLMELFDGTKLPCAHCFTIFEKPLTNLLLKRKDVVFPPPAGASRTPRSSGANCQSSELLDLLEKRDELQAQLDNAVEAEDYLAAAAHRNELEKVRQEIEKARQDTASEKERETADRSSGKSSGRLGLYGGGMACFPPPQKKAQILLNCFCSFRRNLSQYPLPPQLGHSESAAAATLLASRLQCHDLFRNAGKLAPCPSRSQSRHSQLNALGCSNVKDYPTAPDNEIFLLCNPSRRSYARFNWYDHLEVMVWGSYGQLSSTVQEVRSLNGILPENLFRPFPLNGSAPRFRSGFMSRELDFNGTDICCGLCLFIPALVFSGQIEKLQAACSALGAALTPWYDNGDDHRFPVCIWSLHAHILPDVSPSQAAHRLLHPARLLREHELRCRADILASVPLRLQMMDKFGRIAGAVRGAVMFSEAEARHILEMLWLGSEMGAFPRLSKKHIFGLYSVLPLNLVNNGKNPEAELDEEQLKSWRGIAELFRLHLAPNALD